MKKIDHVLLFCELLLDFEKRFPEDFTLTPFKGLPKARMLTPFDRDKRLEIPIVQKMVDRFGRAFMKKIYLLDWEFVKVISYDAFFIEHLNRLDDHYDTIYNILGDDILYTEFFVPSFMVKFKCQHHLYLKKEQESISYENTNIQYNDGLE